MGTKQERKTFRIFPFMIIYSFYSLKCYYSSSPLQLTDVFLSKFVNSYKFNLGTNCLSWKLVCFSASFTELPTSPIHTAVHVSINVAFQSYIVTVNNFAFQSYIVTVTNFAVTLLHSVKFLNIYLFHQTHSLFCATFTVWVTSSSHFSNL